MMTFNRINSLSHCKIQVLFLFVLLNGKKTEDERNYFKTEKKELPNWKLGVGK